MWSTPGKTGGRRDNRMGREMAQPHHPAVVRASAAHRLAMRTLSTAVHAFVWKVLDRLRVPESDRDDLAQDIVLDALRCWPKYCAERGTPGQWLWGIVRNHVRSYRRARGRGPGVLAGDELLDGPSAGPTLEESVSQQRLAA